MREYADAVALRRHLSALAGDLPFEQALEVAEQLGITQKPEEIRVLYELLREERPTNVLEIGLDQAGTLFLWTRAAASDAHLISLDTCPVGRLGGWSPFVFGRGRLGHSSQRVDLLLPANSHADETVRRVKNLLRGDLLDFLFVDGDHSYEGVWDDFGTYAPLVRPGGLVAFHDISPRTTVDTEGVARFWREFAADHVTTQIVAPGSDGFGIGLYRVPLA